MTNSSEQQPASATTESSSAQPVHTERVVEQASRESFPASDPPSFTPARSGRVNRDLDDMPLEPANEARQEARAWGEALCTAMDQCDSAALAAMLTEDAIVRVGSAPQLVGRVAAESWFALYLSSLGSTVHHITDVRADGDAVFVEAEVNVRTHDGAKLMRPEAISARLRNGVASRLIVYGAPSVGPAAI